AARHEEQVADLHARQVIADRFGRRRQVEGQFLQALLCAHGCSLVRTRSPTTAPSTMAPPRQVIGEGTSPKANHTSAGASGVSSAPIKAERGAEIRRVPMVSSSRPSPNCKVLNRNRLVKSSPVALPGSAHGQTRRAHKKADSDAAGSMHTARWRRIATIM